MNDQRLAVSGQLYQILQWTPFPNRFENMSEWQLQAAEYDLKLNKKNYYEHAVMTSNGLLYPLEIAERIVVYWEKRWAFADYQLKKSMKTPR